MHKRLSKNILYIKTPVSQVGYLQIDPQECSMTTTTTILYHAFSARPPYALLPDTSSIINSHLLKRTKDLLTFL